eukprot:m.370654 g.370654  ORF g.370654 m.370654 type:complete len:53 (+) comp20861_c0_seq17:1528-1686(+)
MKTRILDVGPHMVEPWLAFCNAPHGGKDESYSPSRVEYFIFHTADVCAHGTP